MYLLKSRRPLMSTTPPTPRGRRASHRRVSHKRVPRCGINQLFQIPYTLIAVCCPYYYLFNLIYTRPLVLYGSLPLL